MTNGDPIFPVNPVISMCADADLGYDSQNFYKDFPTFFLNFS